MQTILVTGSNGLLGQKIIYSLRGRPEVNCIAVSRGPDRLLVKNGYRYEEMDLNDAKSWTDLFRKVKPDSVIHTAALTNVDACESKKEEAWKTNVEMVGRLLEECKKHQSHLVHLSTDFVFDGVNGPYVETDKPNPLSYYARTKYEAEKLIEASAVTSAILRTIIIYGVVDDNSRSNVVLWAVNSLLQGKTISVINDQYRSPTLAEDLADACIEAALRKTCGIYHVSGRELMCLLDLVKVTADYFGLDKNLIVPISSEALNQPAKRPPITGFLLDKAERDLAFRPHSFLEGLSVIKNQLKLVGYSFSS